jgi:BirA family biotin operon repressor/biotin-[acetyl-CoA-carboxylase] ligase
MKNEFYKKYRLYCFDELESTNVEAFKLANLGEISHNSVIIADKQSAGRGRLDRKWVSEVGNLYFSMVLMPKKQKVAEISFVAAVSLQNTLKKLDLSAKIENKWPNDILVDGKKIAGILLESKFLDKNCQFVILGIGVNLVNNPQNVMFEATNLLKFGEKMTNFAFLEVFLDEFEQFYQKWQDFGFEWVRNLWLENAYKLGKNVAVDGFEGVFKGLDVDGSMLIDIDGEVVVVSVGDVS